MGRRIGSQKGRDGRRTLIDPVIPFERLPDGFLRFLDDPPDPPAIPRPSATLVLLRNAVEGLEVLLLKRSPGSGFIPGAWVFPGGTVDPDDGAPTLFSKVHGIGPDEAAARLGPIHSNGHPAMAFWVAALRETFEETGVLLWAPPGPAPSTTGPDLEDMASAREDLLSGKQGFGEVLDGLGIMLDGGALEYCGHWLTPECEPRRYETRFFAAEVDRATRVDPYEKEMADAVWISPAEALDRNRGGNFPLVVPTMVALEELRPFDTPSAALDSLRGKAVSRLMPAPERTEGGVRFRITAR